MSDNELLVALLKQKSDFAILKEQNWYRIPVINRPKRWPPKYIAFYQPGAFKDDAFLIRYYGEVNKIDIVTRRLLFPNEFENLKSDNEYFKISVEGINELAQPIPSRFSRRLVFISTTMDKFLCAEQINDLFDDSPLEDKLWSSMKLAKILAERQWSVKVQENYYQLDFVLFCNDGKIDIETDGDYWHSKRENIDKDNNRNNALTSNGWQILRFNGKQIHEDQGKYCLGEIESTINTLGGLSTDGLVPRKFYPKDGGIQQLKSI